MSMQEQMHLLDWVRDIQSIALFIEPIGKGEMIDSGKLKTNTKAYYDNLFKHKGFKIIKEGKFIWIKADDVYEHYTHTESIPVYISFHSTYFWIVS